MNALFSHKIKIFTALLLSAAIIALPCCVKAPEPEEPSSENEEITALELPDGSITVPYTELDSLNPFFCSSLLNFSLISLVYDPLFYLDLGFMPQKSIASDYSLGEGSIRVAVDDSLVFSDSSAVSAQDVVYSFERAKNAPLYKEGLKNIVSCEADGAHSVIFTLENDDINALNLLTFPIVKLGSAEEAGDMPIGSGCYKFERDELRLYLEYNLRHAGGIPEIGTVRLREVNESASLMHLLNTGSIDCFYSDMSDGVAKRSYSGTKDIYLNNLVFLGVNHHSRSLSSSDLRKAISLALSRVAIAQNAFVSHATAAIYPFNSSWDMLSGAGEPRFSFPEPDINAALALLESMSLGSPDTTLYLTLICREENSFMKNAAALIAEQLSLVNISVKVKYLSSSEFSAALADGGFDLYLSEIKLTKNMDLSGFFRPSGSASFGIDLDNTDIDESYFSYVRGTRELSEFLLDFDNSLPFIPLLFRNGQFCYSRSIKSGIEATEDRLFLNVADWET
ncbi:MAG: hypothetical protein J1E34_09085 [Oscillospiraceae bacterium]|nr:hypothetical protein [Oscillospiraceae bacterium]